MGCLDAWYYGLTSILEMLLNFSKRGCNMSYYYAKKVELGFDEAVERITETLKDQGFGVLTDIDVKETLKKKLDVDFRNYRILGACNPSFAHRALTLEPFIGILLPCNAIVQEWEDGGVEAAVMNPMEALKSVQNPEVAEIAEEATRRLRAALDEV
jgi:uncharacterized protein (DUF302 family)